MPRPSRPRPPSDPAPLAAAAPLQSRSAPPLRYAPAILILLVSTALGVALVITGSPPAPESEVVDRPVQMTGDGYVSSDTCRACHPAEYESWHGSYHRTMTQVATPDTARADFDGVQVDAVHGDPMHLERRGDELWAEFDDPGWEGPDAERPRIRRRVVLMTGSHHQNVYWYATGHDRGLNILPGAYLLAERQWVARSALVLHPPGQSLAMLDGHWNAVCIVCHTTLGRTAFDTPYRSVPFAEQAVDTTVAEFGIACESCHGPAEAHVEANRNPLRRYGLHLAGDGDPTIVQPATLDPRRSSQVCGQCHSVWEFYDLEDERRANRDGLPYRPGDELRDTRFVAQPAVDRTSADIRALVAADPEFVRGSFWRDGTIRVSGREYNGLLDSPCFRDAETPDRTLSCFSCHTLHKTADDPRTVTAWAGTHQVSTGMDGDEACLQCHEPLRADPAAHTRHAPESAGSRCYNCHMPYTSYGLLKAIRSHTVGSPSAAETAEVGRPNACNLCHLDKTLAWTADRLDAWYGIPAPPLREGDRAVAAGLRWMLAGDAGLRALTAWSMGWEPAQEASGTTWMVAHLGEALGDPYDAVRFIAARSLRSLPGYANLEFDFTGPRQTRVDTAVRVLREWRASPAARLRREPELLVDERGELRVDAMRRLFDARDRRPLFLRE